MKQITGAKLHFRKINQEEECGRNGEKLESFSQKQENAQENQRRRRSVTKDKGDDQQDIGGRVRTHVWSQTEHMQVPS